jgi:hypothetical protein
MVSLVCRRGKPCQLITLCGAGLSTTWKRKREREVGRGGREGEVLGYRARGNEREDGVGRERGRRGRERASEREIGAGYQTPGNENKHRLIWSIGAMARVVRRGEKGAGRRNRGGGGGGGGGGGRAARETGRQAGRQAGI